MDDKAVLTKLIDTEIDLLKHLSHPNIVSFHELLKDGDGQQRVIMEYCAGGDLATRLSTARTSGWDGRFCSKSVYDAMTD
jgi:serine/threonine protein kinase